MSIDKISVSRLACRVACGAGGLSVTLGLLVLFGWHTHTLWLLHIHPSFVAMAYNAALGFFLCGAGLVAIVLGRPRLALAGGFYGVLCGALTLGEYIFQRSFGIDELLMRSYTTAGVTNHGRMAYMTALCFFLMGIFQSLHALCGKRPTPAWLPWASALIGSLIAGLGTVALSGYFIGITNYYAWGQFTRMAVHTALGFLLLGLGILASDWYRSVQDKNNTNIDNTNSKYNKNDRNDSGDHSEIYLPRWLPLPIAVGVLAVTLCLWQALIVQQQTQLDWLTRMAGKQALPRPLTEMYALVPPTALGVGLILATLLAWLVFLAQTNGMRAMQIASANQELQRQMTVRQEAEEALRDAHAHLELRVQERTVELTDANQALHNEITSRERLENQLLEAQKLESVGRLAGGVAHDFNNMLTAILGYAELAAEECEAEAAQGSEETRQANAALQEHLHNITHAAESAANLTRQLLAFARRQVIEPKTVNLNTLLANLNKLLRRLIGEHIELLVLPHSDLHLVKVDPGQFEQILVNLVVNARDAMPDGGKITIETQNVMLDEEYAQQHGGVAAGEHVLLTVSDTGVGMEEGIRLHIFEPFFTTKEKGRGTGLGLATVYGIVKQAGGHIWLYSEPGEGTTFKIYLPRVQSPETALPECALPADIGRGTATILVVEDEPALRSLAVLALRKQGYTVLEAENGRQAFQAATEYAGVIHLLVTDVIMPYMGGKELADRLRQVRSGFEILYTSGYTDDAIVEHGVLEANVAFLQKPFSPTVLVRKVQEVLEAKARAAI